MDYKSYDYKQVVVKEEQLSFYIDCYANFGWRVDENIPIHHERGQCLVQFKRDRALINKVELTRLERNFDACLTELNKMENSRTNIPTIEAITLALVGTAFVAGATFAATAETPLIVLSIVLAIPGFLGWGLAYPFYRRSAARRTQTLEPFISAKRDELDEICRRGHSLL